VTESGEGARQIRALLLDVEGTTTPISFVYDVLFPYARRHLHRYLATNLGGAELSEVAAALADEWSADAARGELVPRRRPAQNDAESLSEYLNWLMDRDRKSPALKRLQGRIWERGYDDAELRGEVFTDVPPAFARWTDSGLTIAIYSSGSVLAQRLLFAHSDHGDLTPRIARYFDTGTGPKRSPESYTRIASSLDLEPDEIAFVSDVDAELEAAHNAGCRVVMCVRPGNAATDSGMAPTVDSFDAIDAALRLAAARS
jgi:enolase-phosphatase E1